METIYINLLGYFIVWTVAVIIILCLDEYPGGAKAFKHYSCIGLIVATLFTACEGGQELMKYGHENNNATETTND